MDTSTHTLACLFAQLGLPSDEKAIENFIQVNKGLPAQQHLYQANCWNKSQAQFLQESIQNDSDWADIVDSLDNLLR